MREETRGPHRAQGGLDLASRPMPDIILRRVKRTVPLARCCQTADPAATVGLLLRSVKPVSGLRRSDELWSRDVPHEKIVDECIDALHALLCCVGRE